MYNYDHAGQMTSASKSATDGGTVTDSVNYSFDAFGNRLQRQATSGSTTTTERFAYDGWDTAKPGAIGSENFDVYADLNSSNSVTNRRLFGPSFDEPLARQDSSGVVAWYGTDQLGSVRTVFDNSGTVTGTRSYSGFGEITSESGSGLDRYAYTAREWDSAAELQYSRARMYDPKISRWTSEDPIGFAAGDPNLHRYVGNGATLARDPSGLAECSPEPNGNRSDRILDYQIDYGLESGTLTVGSTAGGTNVPSSGGVTNGPQTSSAVADGDGPAPPTSPAKNNFWDGVKGAFGTLYNYSPYGQIDLARQIVGNTLQGNKLDNENATRQGKEGPSLLESARNEASAMGQAGLQGLKTGAKASINALSDTVVSTVTLGTYTNGTLWAPTQEDRDSGYDASYGFGRAGYEILSFIATRGGGTAGKGAGLLVRAANGARTGLTVLGRAESVVSAGRGIYDISQNGLTLGNVVQTGFGILGMKGMAGRLADTRINTGLSSIVHGKLGNSVFHKPLAAVGNFLGFKVCFAAGTPIRTPGGWKAIEELAVGDLVLSRDEHNCDGVVEAKPVEEVFVREGLLWKLRVGGQVIKTTAEHPFFVLNKGWIAANLLQVGDGILTEAGHWQAVEGIRDTGIWTTVYNVCVADWHTYFVGNDSWGFGLWAHNADARLYRILEDAQAQGMHQGKQLFQRIDLLLEQLSEIRRFRVLLRTMPPRSPEARELRRQIGAIIDAAKDTTKRVRESIRSYPNYDLPKCPTLKELGLR